MNIAIVYSTYVLVILLSSSLSANSVTFQDVVLKEWEEFKLKYDKQFESSEDYFRMKIFMENKHKIAEHNALYVRGLKKYRLAMNEFGDKLHYEFIQTMNGFKRLYRNRYENGTTYLSPANVAIPKQVDWREKGYVTPVKNQATCGSCWAFSSTGSLEGQHFRKTGVLVSLSEQNLIDCSTKYGNEGCNGGIMDQAFSYVKNNHGIDTEKSYPYEGMDGKCRYSKRNIGATDSGFVDIPEGNEEKLKEAVATVGPISVAIDASHDSFMFYAGGIYDEPKCSTTQLDHGVLVVGYGTNISDDYWIVKNSWGTNWGISGYILMSRNKENQCGIASQASYPLV
uniref:Cathepsin L-like cysteine peptidase 3 protein n=1 Tax=Tityus serrulatus TaxID=6887 RepID=U6JPA9_TITSE|nr:cathepsin L-like cysteine peptidase 3 protein [Tityus serrulatus]